MTLQRADVASPIEKRVDDLLARMTLEEKVAQLTAIWDGLGDVMPGGRFDPGAMSARHPHGIGHVTRPGDTSGASGTDDPAARWRTPAEAIELVNAMQKWAVEETRLGIPLLFHEECLHGLMAAEGTMFPQAIALAGTFDPGLVRDVNSAIAREVRARGVPFVLSPVVDIVRDPRWGRIEETFGEDPYLVTEMGLAAVQGLQGEATRDQLDKDKVCATLKHMTGHGQPEAGNNAAPAPLAERELRDYFFPPFREIVRRGNVAAVMPSYNEIDGIPSHKNRWLLKDVLRAEWGFDGLIVSDYFAIEQLRELHRVAGDLDEAARQALLAGVDSELPDGSAYPSLSRQVKSGVIGEGRIDDAVRRVLELKMRCGLFENPYVDPDLADAAAGAKARALALDAARRSVCLLANDGTLPLDPARAQTIAVIGPNAAVTRLGGYSSEPAQRVSLLDGMRTLCRDAAEIVFAQGCRITVGDNPYAHDVVLADREDNRALIAEATEVARAADVIVLAIGDTEQTSREGWARNHLGDRTSLDLVGEQNELFDALHALGKPVVVCAINGRPPSWPNVVSHANAVLECWYLGQEGGTAIAEALFGVVNPGAKLPVSVVRNAGQVPYFYNHKPTAKRGYLFDDATPLFPFGHGLSYTTFDIGTPELAAARVPAGDAVDVSVTVANTGDRAGDEVVQLYVRDCIASVAQPVKKLRAFERVTLEPGEQRTVRFTLGAPDFALLDADMLEVIEPGEFEIMAGGDSASLKSVTLEL
ncbi:MAG: glycoside hydrolase family 3 N-terminal domain-containing protein, partial [Woeseiaceae bacterium]